MLYFRTIHPNCILAFAGWAEGIQKSPDLRKHCEDPTVRCAELMILDEDDLELSTDFLVRGSEFAVGDTQPRPKLVAEVKKCLPATNS